MPVRIVRLGTPRQSGEQLRLGTVRRPPRGVRKTDYATLDYYDVWVPELAPSAALVSRALKADSDAEWKRFTRGYESELRKPEASRLLDLVVAMSRHMTVAVGCYCEDESRCHRAILRRVLRERGADVT